MVIQTTVRDVENPHISIEAGVQGLAGRGGSGETSGVGGGDLELRAP